MPNYAFCTLKLIGPLPILKDLEAHKLEFSHYVPLPAGTEGRDQTCELRQSRNLALSDGSASLATCKSGRDVWSTRSSGPLDLEMKLEEDDCTLTARFMTAWSPPFLFLERLLVLYPSLWIHLNWDVEGGWGTGIWIHYMKHGSPFTKQLDWREAYVGQDGNLHNPDIRHDEDD
jgi:hypothetical protein